MKRFSLLVAFFLNLNNLCAITNLVLEWEKVEGAKAYHIQIRDSNKNLLVDEKTEKTQFEFKSLDAGTYEHRVGVYNKFGKLSAYTEWTPFTIIQTFPPELNEPKEVELEESNEVKSFILKGKNFSKKMKIFISTESSTPKPLEKKFLNDSEVQVAFNMKEYPPAKYNLILENSPNKKTEIKDFLKVKPKPTATEVKEELPTKKEKKEITEKEEPSEPYPYWREAWQSTYFPGLGQWNKDHKIKAVGFGVLLVGSIAYYIGTVRDFKIAQKNYEQTVLRSAFFSFLFPPQTALTLTTLATNENAFQSASYKASLTKQAIGGIGTIYALNILDALFWKKSKPQVEEFSWFPQLFFYSNFGIESNFHFNSEVRIHWNYKF